MMIGASDRNPVSQDPLEVADLVISLADDLRAEVEAYVQFGRTVTVKVFDRSVESVTVGEPRGVGIRAVRDGKTGYAFSTDMSAAGITRAVTEVKGNLEAADEDPYSRLPSVDPDDYQLTPGLWCPGVSRLSLEEKTDLALRAEASALDSPGVGLVEESVYGDEEEHVAMASTLGVRAEARQSYGYVYVVAHAGHEDERQSGLGFDAARDPHLLDVTMAGRDAAEKAAALVGARPCETGAYTLVLDREVAAAILSTVVQSLSADAVLKGRSVFKDKIGTAIGSPVLTLLDDGLHPGGAATCPFDGEGVPQQVTTLIQDGVLRSYLYDHRSAEREGGGARSTGNSRRASYRALPRVGASNLVVSKGEGTLDGLMKRVGEGLYVESVAGLHSGVNPVSGEISLGVSGRLIEGGVAASPVREVTIATDFSALLNKVCDIAGDARWIPFYGSVNTPSIAIEGVTVSGV